MNMLGKEVLLKNERPRKKERKNRKTGTDNKHSEYIEDR